LILRWLPRALRDRDAQIDYIAERSPRAAIEHGDRIARQIDTLLDHLPPHVHLVGGAVNVRISLETFQCVGYCPHDLLDEAVQWVKAHHAELMEDWKKWHP